MAKGKLFFCVALPRAGKSTFCNEWIKDKESSENPRVIVGGDDFRTAIHGMSFLPNAEAFVFATMDAAIKALLWRGFDVIVDETCTTQQTLLRYMRIDVDAQPIWIETSSEECKIRAIRDNKPYLLGPIDRMTSQLETMKRDYEKFRLENMKYIAMRLTHDNLV